MSCRAFASHPVRVDVTFHFIDSYAVDAIRYVNDATAIDRDAQWCLARECDRSTCRVSAAPDACDRHAACRLATKRSRRHVIVGVTLRAQKTHASAAFCIERVTCVRDRHGWRSNRHARRLRSRWPRARSGCVGDDGRSVTMDHQVGTRLPRAHETSRRVACRHRAHRSNRARCLRVRATRVGASSMRPQSFAQVMSTWFRARRRVSL